VRLQHFATGAAIPFLVDWFRIDDPRSVRPTNIAAVCRDLTTQKRSEAELRHLNETLTLKQRVATRTRELADANLRLVAESVERRRMDARMQKLQLELYHAARFSEAGQMAAALAYELNQPLTAAANFRERWPAPACDRRARKAPRGARSDGRGGWTNGASGTNHPPIA
jgi:two-component system, LuxR family, sensor kinase FixL